METSTCNTYKVLVEIGAAYPQWCVMPGAHMMAEETSLQEEAVHLTLVSLCDVERLASDQGIHSQ